MGRRLAARTSAPPSLRGPALALVLASALIVVTGPGAPAAPAPPQSHARPTPDVAQTGAIAHLADALDYDIERIFRFVADEIRYEPYTGILRGATGTLDARAGNSVDQALLLAALLDESVVPYRFARGQLDEATTGELIGSIPTDAAGARLIAQDALARGWDEIAASVASGPEPSGPLAALYDEQARQVADRAAERLELARSRLGETVTLIEAALDEAGVRVPAAGASLPPAEVSDHTWVQVAYGADWLDLDPTLAASEPGAILTPAWETLDQLPDELRHRVAFEVFVERVSGGQLVTDAVLEYEAFADEIAGVPVTFGHVTPSGVQRLGITLSNVFGDGFMDYRPTLDIGSGSLVGDEAVAFGVVEASDLFSDGPSPSTGAGPAEGEATAEWLEVRVTQPGSEPAVARRTVFDRLPADVRHGGALRVDAVQPIELVDVDGTGSTDYPPMLGIETFAIATGPTSAASVVGRTPDEPGLLAFAYHTLRDAMDAQMGLDAGARTFVDGPDIVSMSLDVAEPASVPTVRIGLDIWHRNHGILPLIGSSTTVPEAELVAGVMGHIAERFALEGLADAPGAGPRAMGVGELFEMAATEGIPTLVIQGPVPDSLPYGPMATRSIEEAVTSGHVVVIPAEPVIVAGTERVGWWQVDPATGVTTDVMDDGSGQEVVEYATLETGAVQRIVCYGAMANWAAASIIAAASLFTSLAASATFRLFNAGWGGTRCFAL